MLTTSDKKWVKEAIHESIAELIVDHIQPTLATKEDIRAIDRCFEQVDRRFEQVDRHFDQVDKRFENIEEKLNLIQNTMDSFLSEIKSTRQEQTILTHKTYQDLTPKVEDYEKRITLIEQVI